MATQELLFDGKVKWCRPYLINQWGKYSTNFYPKPGDLERFKELKIKNVFSMDDDGEYIRLNCTRVKTYRGTDRVYDVKVIGPDGAPFREPIGNGSDVTVKVDYYDYPVPAMKGKRDHAIRWSGIRVNNLVPFDSTADYLPPEARTIKALTEHPKPTF